MRLLLVVRKRGFCVLSDSVTRTDPLPAGGGFTADSPEFAQRTLILLQMVVLPSSPLSIFSSNFLFLPLVSSVQLKAVLD